MNDDNGTNVGRRYPLSFAMRYVTVEPGPGRRGVGETVWMSGREVAFIAKGPAAAGDRVSLHIEWPVLLQGEVPLQLILTAEITQRSGALSIAKMTRHEFRTRGALLGTMKVVPQFPVPAWDMRPARQMPASSTVGSLPQRQPVLASAVG